ncbi:MAG: TlpA family protein disulfide reductase [Chitinophagaceae bacterium]|nr:TlpA family protein disulfide reductase [Chitinophagaceae bacterium]
MRKLITIVCLLGCSLSAHSQLAIGDTAPDIRLPDSLGKWTLLSEVKSKLILLDFWAAWCYPCVKSMPDVLKLYQNYHNQGLEIYAVSLDKGYYNWVAECRKQKLPFILVNEAYGFNGKSCKDYKIESIPNKLLIKDGKIIGANMSLYDMEKLIRKELGLAP